MQIAGIVLWQAWSGVGHSRFNTPQINDPSNPSYVRSEPHFRKRGVQKRRLKVDDTMHRSNQLPKQGQTVTPITEQREETQAARTIRRESLKLAGSQYDTPSWKESDSLTSLPLTHDNMNTDKPTMDTRSMSLLDTESHSEAETTPRASLDDNSPRGRRSSSSSFFSSMRRKLHVKSAGTSYAQTSHTTVSPAAASASDLGKGDGDEEATDEGNSDTREKVVTNGIVALVLVQSGAVLASPCGGLVGKTLLVRLRENESDMVHNILQSGLSRTTTHEEAKYDAERDEFVRSEETKSSLRRRTRLKSTALD